MNKLKWFTFLIYGIQKLYARLILFKKLFYISSVCFQFVRCDQQLKNVINPTETDIRYFFNILIEKLFDFLSSLPIQFEWKMIAIKMLCKSPSFPLFLDVVIQPPDFNLWTKNWTFWRQNRVKRVHVGSHPREALNISFDHFHLLITEFSFSSRWIFSERAKNVFPQWWKILLSLRLFSLPSNSARYSRNFLLLLKSK